MRIRLFTLPALLFLLVGCRAAAQPEGPATDAAGGTASSATIEPTLAFTDVAATPTAQSTAGSAPTTTASPTTPADTPAAAEPVDPYQEARLAMVRRYIEGRITDPAVLEAMLAVPRHLFVPELFLEQAYANHPLPIGHGQTISQPLIVALMTELLQLQPGDRVLEIGTGSGYQAAILAEMGMEVYSIEIIPELAARAEHDLVAAGYDQIGLLQADGYFGWEEFAPFEAIIVTAAPDHLPQPLVEQLAEGGRLVIPIGPIGAVQTLWLFQKVEGDVQATNFGPVLFVPLTRQEE